MKKSTIIDGIIEDLKENMFESEEYIFDLVREALETRTKEELKQINA